MSEQAEDDHPPVPITPRELKRYPYFVEWCQELGRPLEDVLYIHVDAESVEVPSDTQWKKFEMTDNYTAGITFKDGSHIEQHEKWSECKMKYAPEEKETTE